MASLAANNPRPVMLTEQSVEEQQYEALRRIRHIVKRSEGMTRNEIIKEVRVVAEDGLRLSKAGRER